MLSNSNVPHADFSLADEQSQSYRSRLDMRYLHGDYDLYGLIDVDRALTALQQSAGMRLAEKVVWSLSKAGHANMHSPGFRKISHFLNEAIGKEMIQHGSQDAFGHKADKLYGFTLLENAYVINGTEAAIRDLYKQVFKEQPIKRSA